MLGIVRGHYWFIASYVPSLSCSRAGFVILDGETRVGAAHCFLCYFGAAFVLGHF